MVQPDLESRLNSDTVRQTVSLAFADSLGFSGCVLSKIADGLNVVFFGDGLRLMLMDGARLAWICVISSAVLR